MAGPRQNTVTPEGAIVATALRGSWLGNRGILHDGIGERAEVVRLHRGPLWIICALRHKDWRLPQWQPGHFTVLFFHDEAVALAAGHRPCALCRRPAYDAFRSAWVAGNGGPIPRAYAMDRQLHEERLLPRTRTKRTHQADWPSLAAGAFVRLADGAPALVLDDRLVPWARATGYAKPVPRPQAGSVVVLTPRATVSAIRAGYVPQIDPRAGLPSD